MTPSEKLAQLGLTLPPAPQAIGSYVPGIRAGRLIFVSGQLPFLNGQLTSTGKVATEVDLETARGAARQAGLNALAIAANVAGGIDRIGRIVRLAVFVNSAPGFSDQPKVANGASDLMVEVFGEAGRHARAAVGAAELPMNASVEVEMVAELAGDVP
ncbi:Putative reactive intermediate deaminase TdcF [Phycisphaerae bacterium RAS2]|nr:Putative reactive intermediate deaminase TdcF [Phycisphaerae bacterium RAS2]